MGSRGESSRSRRGRGETVVLDHGRRKGSCGYCRAPDYPSVTHGMSAESMTVEDYQELLDRGWRRSGTYLYKPIMEKTCCPSYTIRLKASEFKPSKEQARVLKKMDRFLDGSLELKKGDEIKEKSLSSGAHGPGSKRTEEVHGQDPVLCSLSDKINNAVMMCVKSGDFPSDVQLPKAVVKVVKPQVKRKLVNISEDLLYTSSIAFQIVAMLRQKGNKEITNSVQSGSYTDLSLDTVAEKLVCSVGQLSELSLYVKACNGHLNFYSSVKQLDSFDEFPSVSITKKPAENSAGSCNILNCHEGLNTEYKRRRLEIRMKRSSYDPEEYALYKKYQIRVHNDTPETVTKESYRRFLVDTPLIPCSSERNMNGLSCEFGSFHQQYLIDGKLIAVGVLDVLPSCLSSKYLFWDPDFAFLSLGKYSALKEIEWVKEAEVRYPKLQYYYLGYYIHSCSKMRYKAAYSPAELLCPLRYQWVPFHIAKPLLDRSSYVVLSDFPILINGESSSSQLPSSQTPKPCAKPGGGSYLDNDDDGDMDIEYGLESTVSDESRAETGSEIDAIQIDDVGNIMIELKGSRVKFKNLQQVFGRLKRESLEMLKMQLFAYARLVGKELAGRIIYKL